MYSEAESALIALCLKGNRTAQHRMYRMYCDAMYNVCYRMTGTEVQAQDVLQESFIDIFKNLHAFRGDSSLGAWIKRIVINHCLNHLKQRRIVFEEIKDQHADTMWEAADDGEDDAQEFEVSRVRKAIMMLPDGYRQVLTLYLLEGYDHSEIAEILGIQEGGSKSQYSRARAKLKEILTRKVLQ